MKKGYLILETGEVFEGEWIGAEYETTGEVVFNTAMTGYQEMLTDPSYAGQLLTFSYPLIGNYGFNGTDDEGIQIAASAVLAGEVTDAPNHYQSISTVSEKLKQANIPGLKNIDTRAVVAAVRKHQTVRGKLAFGKEKVFNKTDWEMPQNGELVHCVSVREPIVFGEGEHHVVLWDFGYKKSMLTALLQKGCKVTVVPYHITAEEVRVLQPDGVLVSNGPGDPLEMEAYFPTIREITSLYPSLGICLGHQLIALSFGAQTEKMPFGHRGSNHPVLDVETGKVCITSQNHGYVVKEDSLSSLPFGVLFQNVNDKTLEGLRHVELPIQTVQFHPEAHPGPSDSQYIFDEFLTQIQTTKQGIMVKS